MKKFFRKNFCAGFYWEFFAFWAKNSSKLRDLCRFVVNFPFLSLIIKSAKASIAGSCETITIVVLYFLLIYFKARKTILVLVSSRAPVGSSAKITLAFLTRARRIEILCCCPQTSAMGIWTWYHQVQIRQKVAQYQALLIYPFEDRRQLGHYHNR
ncbi:hypothetical protein CIB43_00791 [Mesomycoplasma hyopneumoniae]|uniref:Uncharacterized protein n=1 Tax=Mesomycoplasma hyopneumoniae TaxID=2099 RepID=A0A223MB48_MESHO|nr:hypothetical protein CIB43_00791 [Mesomycoplasma hyopneumoniae]